MVDASSKDSVDSKMEKNIKELTRTISCVPLLTEHVHLLKELVGPLTAHNVKDPEAVTDCVLEAKKLLQPIEAWKQQQLTDLDALQMPNVDVVEAVLQLTRPSAKPKETNNSNDREDAFPNLNLDVSDGLPQPPEWMATSHFNIGSTLKQIQAGGMAESDNAVQQSLVTELLEPSNFFVSDVHRCLRVAMAAYGIFDMPESGVTGENVWEKIFTSETNDLMIKGLKESPSGWSIEIGYRGSLDDPDHWWSAAGNSDIALVDWSSEPCLIQGKVHRGFEKAYRNLREVTRKSITQSLKRIRSHDKNAVVDVLFTGHSRGAALAALAAVDLAAENPKEVGIREVRLVTWACPRVGDGAFAKFANSIENLRVARFENKLDIVPRVPLQGKFMEVVTAFFAGEQVDSVSGYEHFGEQYVLDQCFNVPELCRTLCRPLETFQEMHSLKTYGVNLRNQFREALTVISTSVLPMLPGLYSHMMRCIALVTPQTSVKYIMGQQDFLVQKMDEESRNICNLILEESGGIKRHIDSSTSKIISTMKRERFHAAWSALKTGVLTDRVFLRDGGVPSPSWFYDTVNKLITLAEETENLEQDDGVEQYDGDVPASSFAGGLKRQVLLFLLQVWNVVMRSACTWAPGSEGKIIRISEELVKAPPVKRLLFGEFFQIARSVGLSKQQMLSFFLTLDWPTEIDDQMSAKTVYQLCDVIRLLRLLARVTGAEVGETFGDMACSFKDEIVNLRTEATIEQNAGEHEFLSLEGGGQYEGTACDSQPEGVGTAKYPSGHYYDGEWLSGRRHGIGTAVFYKHGVKFCTYHGTWRNGHIHGSGTCSSADGGICHAGLWNKGEPVRLQTLDLENCMRKIVQLQHVMLPVQFEQALECARLGDVNIQMQVHALSGEWQRSEQQPNQVVPREFRGKQTLREEIRKHCCALAAVCVHGSQDVVVDNIEGVKDLMSLDGTLFSQCRRVADISERCAMSVAVVGPVKAGKSTAINALVGEKINPATTLPMTVLPVVLEHTKEFGDNQLLLPNTTHYIQAVEMLRKWRGCQFWISFDEVKRGFNGEEDFYDKIVGEDWDQVKTDIQTAHRCLVRPSDAQVMLCDLNHLCRIVAICDDFIRTHLLMPCYELCNFDKLGASEDDVMDKLLAVEKLVTVVNTVSMEAFFQHKKTWSEALDKRDGLMGFDYNNKHGDKKRVVEWLAEVKAGIVTLVRGMPQDAWIRKEEDSEKTQIVQIMKLRAFPQNFYVIGDILHGMLADRSLSPWPRLRCKLSIFDCFSEGDDVPTAFEVIDTPGRNEPLLQPALARTVDHLLQQSSAIVCVCNSSDVSQAFEEIVSQTLEFMGKKHVICLANKQDLLPNNRAVQRVRKKIQGLFNNKITADFIKPVSAESAFLTSWVQRSHDDGSLSSMLQELSNKVKEVEGADEEEEEDEIDDLENEAADDEPEPRANDVKSVLHGEMLMLYHFIERTRGHVGVDADNLRTAAEGKLDQWPVRDIEKASLNANFEPFLKMLANDVAHGALARSISGHLLELTKRPGPLRDLVTTSGMVASMLKQKEKEFDGNMKIWSTFAQQAQNLCNAGTANLKCYQHIQEQSQKCEQVAKQIIRSEWKKCVVRSINLKSLTDFLQDKHWKLKYKGAKCVLLFEAVVPQHQLRAYTYQYPDSMDRSFLAQSVRLMQDLGQFLMFHADRATATLMPALTKKMEPFHDSIYKALQTEFLDLRLPEEFTAELIESVAMDSGWTQIPVPRVPVRGRTVYSSSFYGEDNKWYERLFGRERQQFKVPELVEMCASEQNLTDLVKEVERVVAHVVQAHVLAQISAYFRKMEFVVQKANELWMDCKAKRSRPGFETTKRITHMWHAKLLEEFEALRSMSNELEAQLETDEIEAV